MQMYEKGNKAQAIDSFLNLVGGARCHNLVDKILPGAIYQAIVDADSLFKIDMPAMQLWKRYELITITINQFFQSMDWIVSLCSLRCMN